MAEPAVSIVEDRVHNFILTIAGAKKIPGGCAPPGFPNDGISGRYEEHNSLLGLSKSGKFLKNDSEIPQLSCVSCCRMGDSVELVGVVVLPALAGRTIQKRICWAATAVRTACGQPDTSVELFECSGIVRYRPTGPLDAVHRLQRLPAHAS
jgi:hypothetical protein